jgi:hypothetical protein
LKLLKNILVYRRYVDIYKHGSVIICHFLKYGMQLVVLEISAINLIAVFNNLKTILRFLEFSQNKILHFNNECKYAKYMILIIFLFTNDFIVLSAKQFI